ncbi:MAG: glycosyltransferase [Elusimicrobia bacterium]|nr:glycosyltransferase [Elusimicrobiota bacterium]MBD3411833.1 glycosyltransferase [Elusimicrobiota bacterium]
MIFPFGLGRHCRKMIWHRPLRRWIPIRNHWKHCENRFCLWERDICIECTRESMSPLESYAPIVHSSVISELAFLAEKLKGKRIVHVFDECSVNPAYKITLRMETLFTCIGLNVQCDNVALDKEQTARIKKINRILNGAIDAVSREEWRNINEIFEHFPHAIDLEREIIMVHDLLCLGLIRHRHSHRWIWEYSGNMANPDPDIWNNLRAYAHGYDASVFASPLLCPETEIPRFIIPPSLDPYSDLSKELTEDILNNILQSMQIDCERPLITQVTAFDSMTDLIGVIDAFRLSRSYCRSQLLIVGSTEMHSVQEQVLARVKEKAGTDPDIVIHALPPGNDVTINALQRASTLILHRLKQPEFDMTVGHALWKSKPVIANAVGGTPQLITHKYSGILTHTVEGMAYWIKELLHAPEFAKRLGENGKEHIRQNFLVIRQMRDYMLLWMALDHKQDITSFS